MFTPKLNSSRSKGVTPFGSTKGGRERRSMGLFTPPARSPFTPGRNVSLNRSMQTSQIVEETAQHRLESYGTALPVLITEALTLADRNIQSSVKMDGSGWAWLVCARRLFVWRYKASQYSKSLQCKELMLPPSDLIHSAELVTVLPNPTDPQQVACIAVSPEGAIRYWPSIAHEGSFVEISANLRGEECASLISLQPFHCILATTTSTLLLLSPSPGQNSIGSKPVRSPQGMLSGVGRRMSSFFFGSGAPPATEAALRQLQVGEVIEDEGHAFYMLSGSHLQKWIVDAGVERFLYQFDVEKQLRDCIAQAIWQQDVAQLPNLKTWLLDMQMARDGIVVLGAGMNPDVSDQVYYVLGTLHVEGLDSPQSFLSFTISRFNATYQARNEASILNYRLLLPDPNISSAYLYDNTSIICLSVSSSSQPCDKVDFPPPNDGILGAGKCEGIPLFFSNKHGLISIKQYSASAPPVADISMNETIASLTESVIRHEEEVYGNVTASKVAELSMSEDKTARLKAAFLHNCRGNVSEASQIVEDLFPSTLPVPDQPGSNLDTLVTMLSKEMIDDFPASDPRWAESQPHDGVSSSNSLILLHQLEGKLKAHDYYISFLKNIGIWDRLTSMPVRDGAMLTTLLLCEHAEKITAAMTLRGHHTQFPRLVDQAIKRVLEYRREPAQSGLTPQDIFYRQVSRVHDILEILVQYEEDHLTSDISPHDLVKLISSVNAIVGGVLHDAWQFRQSKTLVYQSHQNPARYQPEYLPWTSSVGPKGIRALLSKQHLLTVEHALPAAQDAQERGSLFQQLLEITDMLLDGYKCQLESIRQTLGETPHYQQVLAKYEQDRSNMIRPFMRQEQYERAASLAEKYCDFAILVELCEETSNQERLHRYMNQFHNKGFADFVFKWYVEAGKRGKLMSSSMASHPALGKFLQSGDNMFMSWLHDIHAADYIKAHQTLYELSVLEKDLLSKKKTLLSLSKLAVLAAEDPPSDLHHRVEAINDEHDLLLHQETLPQEVVESLGMDADNMKVLAARELIELYISKYNSNANEYDFKKALDLLQFIDKTDPDLDYESFLLHIWCQAILRDNWEDISPEDPLENSKDTVFFKTVELAYTEGMDLREYLPTADRVLDAEELGELKMNTNFQYLVKAGYEQVSRILA